MFARMLRFRKPLVEYFDRCESQRALFAMEWQAVQQVTTVVDEAASPALKVQGVRHGFVA